MAKKGARQKTKDDGPSRVHGGRRNAFRALAEGVASGVVMPPPALLSGQARREHVRATLREDHVMRIRQQAAGAEAKFEKLAGSLFSFFRGTALLFYRDMAGQDGGMPTVLALGDVHPGNFGVMPNADNAPIFSVNDFDEAYYAPFTWDLKRGAVGFALAAAEAGGQGPKAQRRIVTHFLNGYMAGMRRYAEGAAETRDEFRMDNSPKIIREIFDDAEFSRSDWLADDYLDEAKRGFRASGKLTPISTRVEEFQGYVDAMLEAVGVTPPKRAGDMKVKDVAIRHGQGTASLGLPRYYVLIEGPERDGSDDLIIEFKQARRSALDGLVPPSAYDAGEEGERIAHGQSVHLAKGDVFYGAVEIQGMSFMSRERAPFREGVDTDDLSAKDWRRYAKACGRALAQAHARSDDAGQIPHDVDKLILAAVQPEDLFLDDLLAFTEDASAQLKRDHAFFRQDFKLGAFSFVEMDYD